MSNPEEIFDPTIRQWLAAIAGVAVLLGIGLYRSHVFLHAQAREAAELHLQSVAALKAQEIRQWLDDRRIILAQPPGGLMAQSFERLLKGGEGAARILEERFRHLQTTIPEIESIWVCDPAGRPLLGSGRQPAPWDERYRAAAAKATGKRSAVLVDLRQDGDGDVLMDFVAPLTAVPAADAPPRGYVLYSVDPRRTLYPMISLWPAASPTSESFLVRREEAAVGYLSPLRHLPDAPLRLHRPLGTPELIAARALLGTDGPLAGRDYRGVPALGAAVAIPETDWMLVAKTDESEIYEEPRRKFLWVTAAALLLLAALLALGRVFVAALRARAREARYRLLAESGSDMVWLYELARGRFTYVSPAVQRLRGFTVDEALGQTLQEVLTPEANRTLSAALPRWIAAFTAADAAGGTRHFQLALTRKDGTHVDTETVATLIADGRGRPSQLQGVSRDITERRRDEAALAESEEKFRAIYDTINDAIFVHDPDSGRIIDVNASAERMYGYRRDEMIRLDVAALSANVAPFTQAVALENIRLARERGWRAFEWLALNSTGRQFWVAVNLQMIGFGGGQKLLAVVHDIDSRKRAEEDLKNALAEAKALNHKLAEAQNQLLQSEKLASIGQLAAGVAHELNNPIGFVSSNLATLDNYLKDIFAIIEAYEAMETALAAGQPQREAVRALRQETDFDFLKTDIRQLMTESKDGLARVAKIVRDLKDFSRAGDAEFQWANLHDGLDSTLNIVWNELKYKCTVRKEYGDLPQVWCVPSQLNQVFMNLLVNAAHAIPEQGEITLRTGCQGEEVFVAVSDTGTGIAPEHLKRIFDPFFTTKPVGKGTGLGLSLAYSIVQKHRGRIEVHSAVGKGTTFTVRLPVQAPAEAAA